MKCHPLLLSSHPILSTAPRPQVKSSGLQRSHGKNPGGGVAGLGSFSRAAAGWGLRGGLLASREARTSPTRAGESGAGSNPFVLAVSSGASLKSVFFKKEISVIFVCAGSVLENFLWFQRAGAAPQLWVGCLRGRLLSLQSTGWRARAQLLHSTWDPPGPGTDPGPPHWQANS